jgi:hypothetical protein
MDSGDRRKFTDLEDDPIRMPEIKPKIVREQSITKPDQRESASLPMLSAKLDTEQRKSEMEPTIDNKPSSNGQQNPNPKLKKQAAQKALIESVSQSSLNNGKQPLSKLAEAREQQ